MLEGLGTSKGKWDRWWFCQPKNSPYELAWVYNGKLPTGCHFAVAIFNPNKPQVKGEWDNNYLIFKCRKCRKGNLSCRIEQNFLRNIS